jgi:hypothetical protein
VSVTWGGAPSGALSQLIVTKARCDMCLQAGAVMNAETSDFLFNRRDLKVLSEDHVRHIPWCISYHA